MAQENNSQNATLGCGTLILIGIIVLFVTQGGFGGVDKSVTQLRGTVEQLRSDIDRLERKVDTLIERMPPVKRK